MFKRSIVLFIKKIASRNKLYSPYTFKVHWRILLNENSYTIRCYIWFRRSFVVPKVRTFKECHFKLNEVISSKIELYIEFIIEYKYDFSLTRKIKGQIQISGSLEIIRNGIYGFHDLWLFNCLTPSKAIIPPGRRGESKRL